MLGKNKNKNISRHPVGIRSSIQITSLNTNLNIDKSKSLSKRDVPKVGADGTNKEKVKKSNVKFATDGGGKGLELSASGVKRRKTLLGN